MGIKIKGGGINELGILLFWNSIFYYDECKGGGINELGILIFWNSIS